MLRKLNKETFDRDELEEICTIDLANQPAQCLSARFVGEDEETLFVYFGRRVITKKLCAPGTFLESHDLCTRFNIALVRNPLI